MIDESVVETIRNWFERTQGGGVILPDGWFGRPYDNFHQLSYIELRPHKLLLELDNQLFFMFTELSGVKIEPSRLIFFDFAQLVFDWQEYGSFLPHASIYKSGYVEIVPSLT